jgi:predicted ATPase/DNA-binding CsgD family transcriptional regulator
MPSSPADIPIVNRYCARMGGSAAGLAGEVHGFPRALTSFIGRVDELGEVAALLGEYRLVTVTGPGGVGKTRLACEVVLRTAGRFADGAWLVELAGVQDPAMVSTMVAAALGVRRVPGISATGSVVAALGRQHLLLVLDNCEHVLGAVADLCEMLLPAADDVHVLATSREPTGVAGEARYRLRPLAVPTPGEHSEVRGPAVDLFTDRARRADPRFVLDGDTAPVVARIVSRLDGMPLAIELATARVEALGLIPLLDRLEISFQLLNGGNRATPPRHQSLAATVDWSYRLLEQEEQQVFRRLAIFPGPFTLDAAVAVAGPAAESAVLHLVDCSLVTPPRTGPDSRSRYVILETLRAFGLDRLADADEHPEVAAALTSHAVKTAKQAANGMETAAKETAAARWLDAEEGNVHQALNWAIQHDRVAALQLATALSPWWCRRGRSVEGYALLSTATGYASPGSHAWCSAQYWLGHTAAATGDLAAALIHFTAARDALEAGAASPALAIAVASRANMLMFLDRIPEGTEDARGALALARELGYAPGEAHALLCMAIAAYYVDDSGSAVLWARQACRIDPGAIPGDMARDCRMFLTLALKEAGEVMAAQASCAEALALAREAGDMHAETSSMIILSDLELRADHVAGASQHLRAAIKLSARIHDRTRLWDSLPLGAELCAKSGRWTEAVTLWAAHQAFAEETGLTPTAPTMRRRQELLQKAGRALGLAQMRTAEERGTMMALETAAEFARVLAEAKPQPQAVSGTSAELARLSSRERELVGLVAQGRTDTQIAAQLYISVRTVRSHLDRIRDKTSCRRRADLTRLALQAGLV